MTVRLSDYDEALLCQIWDRLIHGKVRAVMVARNNAEAENEQLRTAILRNVDTHADLSARLKAVTALPLQPSATPDGVRQNSYSRGWTDAINAVHAAALSVAPQPPDTGVLGRSHHEPEPRSHAMIVQERPPAPKPELPPVGSIVAWPNGSAWLLRSDGWYHGHVKQPGADLTGATVLRRGWTG